MKALISEGAEKRLFRMAINANEMLGCCESDEEYRRAKERVSQWNEIVMALGLSDELRRYYAEKRGAE